LPRLLRSVGALALFLAAHEGASRICREHVADALDTQAGKRRLADATGDARPRATNAPISPIARMAAEPEIERASTPVIAAAPAPIAVQMRLPTPLMVASSDKLPSRRRNFVTAKIFGAAVLPLLLLNGSLTPTSVSATMNLIHQASAMNAMRGLERVAQAERPGFVILVILNPPALQPLQIAPTERRLAIVNKPVTPALPSKKPKPKTPPRTNVTQR
jgi:hypothetical protein